MTSSSRSPAAASRCSLVAPHSHRRVALLARAEPAARAESEIRREREQKRSERDESATDVRVERGLIACSPQLAASHYDYTEGVFRWRKSLDFDTVAHFVII